MAGNQGGSAGSINQNGIISQQTYGPLAPRTFSAESIMLMVELQVEASDHELNEFMQQNKQALAAKEAIHGALSVLAAHPDGFSDHDTMAATNAALVDAKNSTDSPVMKKQIDDALKVANWGGDEIVSKDEVAKIKDILSNVSGDLGGEQQTIMLGLQEAVDRKKRIVELGSNWLSKLDETAAVPIRNMRGG